MLRFKLVPPVWGCKKFNFRRAQLKEHLPKQGTIALTHRYRIPGLTLGISPLRFSPVMSPSFYRKIFLSFTSLAGSPKLAIVVSFFMDSFEWEGRVAANLLALGDVGVSRENPRRWFFESIRSLLAIALTTAFLTFRVTVLAFGSDELFFAEEGERRHAAWWHC